MTSLSKVIHNLWIAHFETDCWMRIMDINLRNQSIVTFKRPIQPAPPYFFKPRSRNFRARSIFHLRSHALDHARSSFYLWRTLLRPTEERAELSEARRISSARQAGAWWRMRLVILNSTRRVAGSQWSNEDLEWTPATFWRSKDSVNWNIGIYSVRNRAPIWITGTKLLEAGRYNHGTL